MNKNETLYTVEFITHRFNQEDLPENEWEIVKSEFMKIYGEFCDFANGKQGYSKLNREFDSMYFGIGNQGEENVDGYLYGSYLAWRMNEEIRKRMNKDYRFMNSDVLEPFVFMDGNCPNLGARLKKYGSRNFTIDFVLRPYEEES